MIDKLPLAIDGRLLNHQEMRRKINELIDWIEERPDSEQAVIATASGPARNHFEGWNPVGDGSYFSPPPGYSQNGVRISGIVRRSEVPREVVEFFFPAPPEKLAVEQPEEGSLL